MQLFSYPSNLNIFLGAQKNRLIETVLLSTHSICFGREIRKIIFSYAHLSGGLKFINLSNHEIIVRWLFKYECK